MMVGNTLEIANFRLSQGTTKEQFLEGVKASNTSKTSGKQLILDRKFLKWQPVGDCDSLAFSTG